MQEASLSESQIANYQARNVGRLTSLATILVPFSVSAGMFSMGGEYLAGEKNF
jgi:Mg2+ and Co2+ transporter CorA